MSRQRDKWVTRIIAWILSFAMIVSLVVIPGEKTKAAEETVKLSYSTEQVTATGNADSKVSLNLGNGGYNDLSALKSAGVTKLRVSFEVSSASGTGNIGGQAFVNAKGTWEGEWINVNAGSGSQTVELDLTQFYGKSGELYNFGFQFEHVSNITYKITEAALVKAGGSTGGDSGSSGGSGGSGGTSSSDTTTNKDLDVEFNYAKALQESLYFYDANMCGNLEGTCALSWRGNCHTYDKNVTYTKNGKTYNVDASGGFHDAGDHVKFGLPQGYAASMLGMSYYQFGAAFDELGQKAHLKKITDYFCDYFKRCTVYEGSEVIAFCYQVGEGTSDHGIWTAPETQTLNRPAYFADADNPATDEVSVAIAALALNYINFGDASDLKTAKDLFAFVKKNNKACATEGASGFYSSDSYGDDYALAASALAAATGDSSYISVYNEYKDNSGNGINQYWVLDWANTGALACMLQKDTAKLASITDVCKGKSAIDGVFNCVSDWGSCRYSAAEQFTGLVYDKLTGAAKYADWATSQMNYMLGDNPNKRCYIVGYNENSSKYPHHRAASRSTDAGIINTNHYTLLGALVGGPGADGTYKDDQADFQCNEVALDYNAGLVGAAAGLYLVHKNDETVYLSYAKKNATNYSTKTASATELGAVGVKTYYGTNSGETEEEVKATAIKLDSLIVELTEGLGTTIRATVTPKTAEQKVTWKSENEKVATVSESGKVTAVGAGETTVTATTTDGTNLTASCKVTVKAAPKAEFVTDQTALACDPVIYGYEAGSTAALVIENKGNDTGLVTIALEKGTDSPFEISGDTSIKVAPSDKTTVVAALKTGKDAGSYSDNLLIEADNEQSFKIPVSATVEKCTVTGITFPTAGMIVAGQTLADSKLTGGDETYGTFAWADGTVKPERGTYQGQAVLTLNAEAKKNYTFDQIAGYDAAAGTITQNVTVTVSRAGLPAITFPVASDLVYGQTLSDSVLTGGSTEYGTFAWSTPDVKMGEQEVANGINQYEVVFTWSDASKKQYQIEDTDEDAVYKKMVSVKVQKAEQTAVPAEASLVARTKDTIRISGQAGVQYSVDGTTWKLAAADGETVEFTGLQSFTRYSISARYAETSTTNAGKTAEVLAVYTLVQTPYTIDVSKIADKEYQDALRTEDGTATIRYDAPELTLTGEEKDYVLTGKNKDIVIKVSGGTKVTLDQAEIGAITITGSTDGKTEIISKETVTVSGDIESDGDLVVRGAGTLTVAGKISAAGDITIKGGKVIVDKGIISTGGTVLIQDTELTAGTDETGTAIKADTVRIEDSKVTVGAKDGSDNAPIQSDNIILVGDNTVTSSDGVKDIYSSKPKNENGEEIPDTILIEKITLNKTRTSIYEGEAEQIAVVAVIPANATKKTFTWSSSDEKVAAVSQTGEIKGIAAGTAVITVQAADGSGVTAVCMVTVKKKESDTPTLPKLDDDKTTTEEPAKPGETNPTTEELAKPGENDSTAEEPEEPADNDSSTEELEEVGDNTSSTEEAESSKTDVKPAKIMTRQIAPGKKLTLKATVTPKNVANKKVKWTIRKSDKKYASINSKGVLTVKKSAKGKTIKVTATAVGNSKVKITYTVKVMKKAVKKVTITAKKKAVKEKTIKKKQSVTLKADLTPTKGTSKEVTWSSSNPKVASVNAKGKVTGKKKGKVKITAKAKDGSGKKATITIRVK